jgi:hypothetical protein
VTIDRRSFREIRAKSVGEPPPTTLLIDGVVADLNSEGCASQAEARSTCDCKPS